ncbi:MAG: BMP family ABC transporter substrate-binding protein [Acidimicrobiales bacterium]
MRDELSLDNPDTPEVHTSRSFLVDTADHEIESDFAHYAPPTSGPLRQPPSGPGLRHQQQRRPGGPRQAGMIQQSRNGSGDPMRWLVLFLGGALVGLVAVWFFTTRPFDGETATQATDDGENAAAADATLTEIEAVLQAMGLTNVVVERRESTVYLIGTAPSEETRNAAVGAATALIGELTLDSSSFIVQAGDATQATASDGARPEALQSELDRLLAATPIIFEANQAELSELHQRVLNNVAMTLSAYPGMPVKIIGFADATGSEEANRQVSLARAENVKSYLVAQGIGENDLITDAVGAGESTGAAGLAGLERRVEFEVQGLGAVPAPSSGDVLRVAIVAPSARNDLAFTQGMVDSMESIAAERGNVEVTVLDNMFVPEEASDSIRDFAAQGFDLIVAHGSQYGADLPAIAAEYPDVAFAWGTAKDTFGLPNVYAYDSAAEQGGYLLGAMSARMSASGIIGVVGPIEVGDAKRYVDGFVAGARAERPDADVRVVYTGSFSDLTLAAEAAQGHVGAGADVLTGTSQMVVGAINVVVESDLLWFGTQANQSTLAPQHVGASQAYHWETILRDIVADVDAGAPRGTGYTATLQNGGLAIEYNDAVAIPDDVKARVEELRTGIVDGSISLPAN